jgi:hypothetical protein
MDEPTMSCVAEWIVQALRAPSDDALLGRLASKVKELALSFPVPGL